MIEMNLNKHTEQHPACQRPKKVTKDLIEKNVINGYEMTPMVVKVAS